MDERLCLRGSYVRLNMGIRQRCPLSSKLYVLVIEVLACGVRAESCVQRILIPGSGGLSANIMLRADDVTSILKTEGSVRGVFGGMRGDWGET